MTPSSAPEETKETTTIVVTEKLIVLTSMPDAQQLPNGTWEVTFTSADGKQYAFFLNDAGKDIVVKKLTGGITIPRPEAAA